MSFQISKNQTEKRGTHELHFFHTLLDTDSAYLCFANETNELGIIKEIRTVLTTFDKLCP